MKKVTVLGGSGFLGSHVVQALGEAGWKVTVLDLRPCPALPPGARMLVGDITDPAAVAAAVKGARAVYNFAGIADLGEAHDRPLDTIRVNILGNGVALEACVRAKVKRYVFASTVYVYSRSGSFYSASKQACEAYIENYRRYRGLDFTILRYGSLYGGRSGDSNIVHKMVKEALSDKRVTYFGDGSEVREYIHVEDAARMSVEALAPEFRDQNLVIAGHQPIEVRGLMEMIREMLGGKVRLVFQHRDAGAPANTHYHRTPYSYTPKIGHKLVGRSYIDLGQGLLRLLDEVNAELARSPKRARR
ncbi:NAD(P)-dependent oxidoreductase [bacterium]|nr:MAG: NAD(P)-dependent oxidoreductase [bacterium]